jgi:hypothetical protein
MGSSKAIQLYIRQLDAPDAPLRSLTALEKVYVEAGQTVNVALNTSLFANSCTFCVVSQNGTAAIPWGSTWAVSIGDGASDMFPPFNLTVTPGV